jgi:flagellin
MSAQVRGLSMSAKNASDALGLLKVVENATNDVTDMLQRIRELAVQAQSGTNSAGDIANLQHEANELIDEIIRVSEDTKYNGKALIGAGADTLKIQVGYNDGDTLNITTYDIKAQNLGVQVNDLTTASDTTDTVLVALKSGTTYLNIAQTLQAEDATTVTGVTGVAHAMTVTTGSISAYTGDTVISDGTTSITLTHGSAPANLAALVTEITGHSDYGNLLFTAAAAANGSDIEFTWKATGAATDATFAQAGATTEAIAGLTTGVTAVAEQLVANKRPGALEVITGAIDQVAGYKAKWGAGQNRLEYTVSNLMNVVEFTSAARSRIEDADFAVEAARLAKSQVLQQTGAAMLAQANAAPQLALSLLA